MGGSGCPRPRAERRKPFTTVWRMQLFVLGMHRSGTSAVTRLLNLAGTYFGPEGISNGADEGNLKGFWERRDVRAICDGLLQESGNDWWRLSGFAIGNIPDEVRERHLATLGKLLLEIDAHRPWVVKEPRLCVLFPLVRPLLEVPVCVHVAREPLEVAQSLETRNGFPSPAGLALWELYTVNAFRATRGLPRLLVHYEDLVSSPVSTVSKLVGQLTELGVSGLHVPAEREITAYISPDLRRARRAGETRSAWLNEPQARLAAAVDDGSVLDEVVPLDVSEGARATLRAFEEDHLRQERLVELTQRVGDLEGQYTATSDRIADLEHDLAAEEQRRRRIEQVADSALRKAKHDVHAYSRSRTARLAWQLGSLRRTLMPGAGKASPPLDRVAKEIEQARQELDLAAADAEEPPPASLRRTLSSPNDRAAVAGPRRGRPKVAVIAWDVGHNPVGRAHTLAGILQRHVDVEIWGAQFRRYGSGVWPPLRGSEIPIKTFPGRDLPDHLDVMQEVARRIDADAVYVSKPRLPSYGLGILAKEAKNRPLVLDIDDHELAFFDEDDEIHLRDVLSMRGDPDLMLPFGRAWTRVCQSIVDAADERTVSNVSLQERFGGVVIPHARDERVFDPDLYDRQDIRRRLGLTTHMRLLAFGGTPRAHKGVVEVLRALARLDDDRYRLLLFGTSELETLRREIRGLDRWVLSLPYQSFADLPKIVAAADLACVIQDPDHPISRCQMPAKIVDALAMRVPCLVRPVPPLRPLLDQGVLHVIDDHEPVHARIASIFDHYDDAVDRARQGRKVFEAGYSYEAAGDALVPLFERLWDDAPRLAPRAVALAHLPKHVFSPRRGQANLPARSPGRSRGKFPARTQYDVVMLWKQNDTGIYGRRQDMILKYLARSDRVGSVVHFDSPTTPGFLIKASMVRNSSPDQGRLVARQTVNRLLHRHDGGNVHHYTFVHRGLIPLPGLRPPEDFPDFVRSAMTRHGIGQRPTVLWVYPTNDVLPDVIDAIDPDVVVADVVDDHRTFHARDSAYFDVTEHDAFEQNYRDVLARSDLVIANCEPVAEAMRAFAPDVQVVSNGLELYRPADAVHPPRELRHLSGPVIGYIGNLSQRLDIPLLRTLARHHREWQFVLVGSAHGNRSVLQLRKQPNVHFVGVKPYDEALQFLQHFDVALIPHVDNDMTRSMNPLKAFVYCASGVPVVSTPVANLGELADLITVAQGPDEFGAAIENAIRAGRGEPDVDILRRHSWERRIEQVIGLIDDAVGATPP
jgi:glycosyltransferase involved in cell wall biosynthesis